MKRLPPRSTRTDTRFPYTTLFRSMSAAGGIGRRALLGGAAGLLIASEPARAAPVQGVVGAPDGDYRSLGMHGKDGSTSWAYPGIRSEERRVGKECVRPCRYWLSPSH